MNEKWKRAVVKVALRYAESSGRDIQESYQTVLKMIRLSAEDKLEIDEMVRKHGRQ